MMLTHAPKIRVNIEDLEIGVGERDKIWWNWDTYINTWRLIDQGETHLDYLPLFDAMRRHYSRWNRKQLQTDLQILGLNQGHSGDIARGWVERHIQLYETIKHEGFDENREKQIEIKIGSNGELVVHDGHNRVSMLMHLRKPQEIPVVVRDRAKRWVTFKEKLYNLYDKKLLYQPMEHPDFQDWNLDRLSEDRLDAILGYLDNVKWKHVLDIGSCTGWFCRRFAERGAYAIGVERNRRRHELAKQSSEICGFGTGNPAYFCDTFENFLNDRVAHPDTVGQIRFDVILFLSVFHHYLRRDVEEAWDAVQLISEYGKTMFMDLSLNNLPLKWSPKLVLKHSEYRYYDTLPSEGRPLYAFMRERK